MEEKHISFEFKGRYYSIGSEEASNIWFVLHGQGQLAKFFLEKFKPLASENCRIIAPEGLSRYYLDGFYGRVGSTWMTKEDRLTDITNYINFLSTIYEQEISDKPGIKLTLLGFSQGAATASRWAVSEKSVFNRLILWGGLFPPDLDFSIGQSRLKDVEVFNVYGTRDQYLTEERKSEQFRLAEQLNVDLTTITYDGGHSIDEKTLLKLI